MASEWKTVRIEDIAEHIAMGPFGSSIKVETFVSDGIPIISGQHLHGFKIDDSVGYNFITEEHADRLKKANVQKGDLIFTHAGNIGQVALIPEASIYDRYVISQRQFYLRCDRNKVISEYLVAYFKSREGQHKLLANSSSVGVPSIAQPVTYLRSIEIQLPPLNEQRAIAHILGTLDDKIELNRKMNETLEAMARAIFKAWFVDFEPVRAKMEGRWQRGQSLPGLPAHLYDLFPDRLVESELGEIPEGWRVGIVSDLGSVICGKTPSTKDPENYGDDIPFLTIPDLHGKVFVTETERLISIKGANTQENKYLPAQSICVSCIASPGLVAITTECCQTNQQINSVIPNNEESAFFCYQVLNRLGYRIRAEGSGGSVLLNLNKTLFSNMRILLPDSKAVNTYHNILKPFFQKILQNQYESATLASLRDTLLPVLISGELRINYAESFCGEIWL